MKITRNGRVTDDEINGLRKAVKWDFTKGSYSASLPKAYAYFTARDRRRLAGFVSLVSDGLNDAFLVDLMVHPDYQRRNVGLNLVMAAAKLVRSKGIQCLQTTFNPWNAKFYRKCGFHILKGGIMDFKHMRVDTKTRPFLRSGGERK
jgi:GNAT superfamily N-acetyltransferase